MQDKILLINDLPGYGKVALSAMLPVLSHMGFDAYNLPTAIVSNTLDYGQFDILDTTDHMERCDMHGIYTYCRTGEAYSGLLQ